MTLPRAVLCGLLLIGCAPSGAPPDTSARARSLPIIGGDPSFDSPATVLLFNVGGGFSSCSGSVVAPRVVVTAKHCLGDDPADPDAPMRLVVLTRPSLSAEYQYDVIDGRTTEGDSVENHDFAVLIVDRDIDLGGAPYYEVDRDVSDIEPGMDVRLIGYGLSDAEGDGRDLQKLETTDRVEQLAGEILYTLGRGACSGDSGGTVLGPDGQLVAVMVRADCAGYTLSERTDQYLDLVDWGLEATGICVVHPEVCDGADNNCDGFVDEACRIDGENCVDDRSCVDGLGCEVVGNESVCARACRPFAPDACVADQYCDVTGVDAGRCLTGGPGTLPEGSPCGRDGDCASLTCAAGACRIGCAPDRIACPWGMVCSPDSNEGGLCQPPSGDAPRHLGDPCQSNGQCALGSSCLGEVGDRYCAPGCAGGCPAGFHCRADACVRGDLGVAGASCLDAGDCGDEDACVPLDAGDTVCAPSCDAGGCGEGFSCVGGSCLPALNLLGAACTANDECGSGLCGHFDDGAACTSPCDAAHACPAGTICALQNDGVNLLCREPPRPASSGCSVAPAGAASPGWLMVLLGLAGLCWSRRR